MEIQPLIRRHAAVQLSTAAEQRHAMQAERHSPLMVLSCTPVRLRVASSCQAAGQGHFGGNAMARGWEPQCTSAPWRACPAAWEAAAAHGSPSRAGPQPKVQAALLAWNERMRLPSSRSTGTTSASRMSEVAPPAQQNGGRTGSRTAWLSRAQPVPHQRLSRAQPMPRQRRRPPHPAPPPALAAPRRGTGRSCPRSCG